MKLKQITCALLVLSLAANAYPFAYSTQSGGSGLSITTVPKGTIFTGIGTINILGTLAVGSNGQYLQADSTQPNGLKWASVSGSVFPVLDSVFQVINAGVNTKAMNVSLSSAAASTQTTLNFAQTANRTINIPDADDTLVGRGTIDILLNKSFPAVITSVNNVYVGPAAPASPGTNAVTIGLNSGATSQGNNTVAIGNGAGQTSQSQNGIAIGRSAANAGQGLSAVAIGNAACQSGEGASAVCIGNNSIALGSNSLALGASASAASFTNAIALGTGATATGNNQAILPPSIYWTTGSLGSGTANASTFLAGDNTWKSLSSAGGLLAANNLSDVANPVTALANIGGIGAATINVLSNKGINSYTNPLTINDSLDNLSIDEYLRHLVASDGTTIAFNYANNTKMIFNTLHGAELEILDGGVSTVNKLQIQGAPTAQPVQIYPAGSDANVDLWLHGKVTGHVQLGNAQLKFPNSDGSANSVLSTDGATNLSFQNATDANTASALVLRDGSGGFSAGDISSSTLTTTGNIHAGDSVSATNNVTAGGTVTTPAINQTGTATLTAVTVNSGLTVASGSTSTGALSANGLTVANASTLHNTTIAGGSSFTVGSLVYPTADSAAGYAVTTNGSGTLSLQPQISSVLTSNVRYVATGLYPGCATLNGSLSCPFALPSQAETAITDASPSKPYVIKIAPGIYNETNLSVKPYISLDGSGYFSSFINVANPVGLDASWSGLSGVIQGISDLNISTTIFQLDFNAVSAAGEIDFNNFYDPTGDLVFIGENGSPSLITFFNSQFYVANFNAKNINLFLNSTYTESYSSFTNDAVNSTNVSSYIQGGQFLNTLVSSADGTSTNTIQYVGVQVNQGITGSGAGTTTITGDSTSYPVTGFALSGGATAVFPRINHARAFASRSVTAGTAYQPSVTNDTLVYVPVTFSNVVAASGSAVLQTSPNNSTWTDIYPVQTPASISSGDKRMLTVEVPATYYYRVTTTPSAGGTVTVGTAQELTQ